MRKTSKMLLSMLLVFVMVMSLLPTAAFADDGSLSNDYVTVKTEEEGWLVDTKANVIVKIDGVQVSSGKIDVGLGVNTLEIDLNEAYAGTYGLHEDYVSAPAFAGKWTNDGMTRVKGTFAGSKNCDIVIDLRTRHTVTVKYDYKDNSEQNSKIDNKGNYTRTVLHGDEFESKSMKHSNYNYSVSPSPSSVSSINNTFKVDRVYSDMEFTVTMDPVIKNDTKVFDYYIDGSWSTLGTDEFTHMSKSVNGYEFSNQNANSKTYLLNHFSPDFNVIDQSIYYKASFDSQKKWYDYSKFSLGLGFSKIENIVYISEDGEHDWGYSYYWTTPKVIDDGKYEWRFPAGEGNTVPIPKSEEGRLNVIYKLHTKDSSASSHVWVLDEAASTPATCEKGGVNVYYCSHCKDNGYTKTKTESGAAALGHDLPDTWTHVDGTEKADSQHTRSCRRANCDHKGGVYTETKACTFETQDLPNKTVYTCSKCSYSYEEPKNVTLTYDANGGSGAPAAETKQLNDNGLATFTLSATKPTHAQQDGKDVLFIGWTAAQDTKIYTKDDTAPTTVSSKTLSADGTVYAVYGLDANGNGTPDVLENKYTLTYDANGGENAPAAEKYLENDEATLSATKPTHAKQGEDDVVFIGWTAAQDTKIYTKDDTAPVTLTTVTMTADTTVYAVYGLDTNGNGIADVLETWYTLSYDANGGANAPAAEEYAENESATLSTAAPTHAQQDGKDVLFIGWTAAKDTKIYTKDDTAPTTVTTVTMTADTTVYAVYGLDVNGNGTPDVLEDKYTLTYDANGGENPPAAEKYVTGETATLSTTAPTHAKQGEYDVVFIGWTAAQDTKIYTKDDTAPVPLTTVTVTADTTVYAVYGVDRNGNGTPDVLDEKVTLSYDVNGGENTPAAETFLKGETAALSTTAPTHAKQGEDDVVFIGWTAAKDTKIYTKDDTAPTTLTTVTMNADTTVYAVYGLDTNGNGTPDVLETWINIKYDANGGSGAPADESVALNAEGKAEYTVSATVPTFAGKKFLGWEKKVSFIMMLFKATTPEYIQPGDELELSESITLKAAWADLYTLTYDVNGGNNDGPAKVEDLEAQTGYALSEEGPTHAKQDEDAVVFMGWSEKQDTKIYTKDDKAPTLITEVDIDKDITVYAVYGLDSNSNGTPDVYETWVTLTYDANGGTGAPAAESKTVGDDGKADFTISDTAPTRKGYTFKGWSDSKNGKVQVTAGSSVTISDDTTVYAVWEKNGTNPKTGDSSRPGTWAALTILSVMGIFGVGYVAKRKEN